MGADHHDLVAFALRRVGDHVRCRAVRVDLGRVDDADRDRPACVGGVEPCAVVKLSADAGRDSGAPRVPMNGSVRPVALVEDDRGVVPAAAAFAALTRMCRSRAGSARPRPRSATRGSHGFAAGRQLGSGRRDPDIAVGTTVPSRHRCRSSEGSGLVFGGVGDPSSSAGTSSEEREVECLEAYRIRPAGALRNVRG